MKTIELTDIDGDALTISQRLDATWITCTKGAEEVTVGPVPTDAVRHAFQEPMGDGDADGGVTAAAFEAEVVSPGRARSLVQERGELAEALDTTMGRAIAAERERDEAARFAALWKEAARRAIQQERQEDAFRSTMLANFQVAIAQRDEARGDCNDALRREKAEQDRAVQAEENVRAREEMVNRLAARAEQAEAALEDLREQYGARVREKDEWEANAEEADRRTAEAEAQRDTWKRHHDRVDGQWAKAEREVTELRRAAQPRPSLTADEVPDAMVLPMLEALGSREKWKH
ncbi:MAG: hypothetical protein ACTH6N_05030, partial [Brachybacterium tyrofermentans]